MQSRAKCIINPKSVSIELQWHHLKENCLSQNLPRNLPEETCSIMKQDPVPGSMPAKWAWNTAHLGLSPNCAGSCSGAKSVCALFISNTLSQAQKHNLVFYTTRTYVCNIQIWFKSISVSSCIPSFLPVTQSLFTDISLPFQTAICLQSAKAKSDRSPADIRRMLIMSRKLQ